MKCFKSSSSSCRRGSPPVHTRNGRALVKFSFRRFFLHCHSQVFCRYKMSPSRPSMPKNQYTEFADSRCPILLTPAGKVAPEKSTKKSFSGVGSLTLKGVVNFFDCVSHCFFLLTPDVRDRIPQMVLGKTFKSELASITSSACFTSRGRVVAGACQRIIDTQLKTLFDNLRF